MFIRNKSYQDRIEFYKLAEADENLLQLAAEWHHEKWKHIKYEDESSMKVKNDKNEEIKTLNQKWKYKIDIQNKNSKEIINIKKDIASLRSAKEKWQEIVCPEVKKLDNVSDRKKYFIEMTQHKNSFYIVTYANLLQKLQPIGMFTLKRERGDNFCLAELDDVYIDPHFRDYGFGSLIVEAAKQIALDEGLRGVELDVLNPYMLDKFYKKRGSHIVCEGDCNGFPTEKHIIDFDKNFEQHKVTRMAMIEFFRSQYKEEKSKQNKVSIHDFKI